jgi:hypothetical protein
MEYMHAVGNEDLKKRNGVEFSKPGTGSDVRYSCHHNSSRFTSAYLRIRVVSLSSIHCNHTAYKPKTIHLLNLKLKKYISLTFPGMRLAACVGREG